MAQACTQYIIQFLIIVSCTFFTSAQTCHQLPDVLINGQRHMQFAFVDQHGKYTTGYVESYDHPGQGSLFSHHEHQASIKNSTAIKQHTFNQLHEQSVTSMKQYALQCSSVTHKLQVDQLYLQGRITAAQAHAYYQHIQHAALIAQAQKQAHIKRKQDKKSAKKHTKLPQKTPAIVQRSEQSYEIQSAIAQHDLHTAAAKHHQRLHEYNQQVSKINYEKASKFHDHQANVYQQIMNQRSQAFADSTHHAKSTTADFKLNAATKAFLQINDIDANQFQTSNGLPIQQQVTGELVDILDTVAQYASNHHKLYQISLTKYCAQLAQVSQQSNLTGALQQALDGTNCCHAINHYAQGLTRSAGKAFQQFQTALHYLQPILEEYALLIEQHAAQGAMTAQGLEIIVTAGMLAAPTATAAVTGIMIGVAALTLAPLCLQGFINTKDFLGLCITGQWSQAQHNLDIFKNFMTSRETIAHMAELAGGATISTPNLSTVIENILALRPVLTRVQDASGQAVQKMFLMTKNQLHKVHHQATELLHLPEFMNFNLLYKKICGINFFDILPKNSLVRHSLGNGWNPALAGIETGLCNTSEQAMLTSLLAQTEESVVGNIVKLGASSLGSQATQIIEQETSSLIAEQTRSLLQHVEGMSKFHEILQQEIMQVLQHPSVPTDLTAHITDAKYAALRELAPQIRQLQDLAKYTNNFTNVDTLIIEDICYLNRIYELQTYRAQIKKFLDTYKPYFMYDGTTYFIEDIASYHIHAGDYFIKKDPRGGHSNFTGNKLAYFNPELIKQGPLNTKSLKLYNSRLINEFKDSSIYPETWTEYMCDLKTIEVMMSGKAEIVIDLTKGIINLEGYTSEGLKIRIGYDIKAKRIKTHYPKFD